MNNQMDICDIFYFKTGETIFAGKLSEEIPVITSKDKYTASLIVDGITYQQNINISGEMIGGGHPKGHRAISTMDKLDINSEFVKNHNCKLVLIESSLSNRK
jgi:hypothetical protein